MFLGRAQALCKNLSLAVCLLSIGLLFEEIDDECLNQAIHLSNLPFAFHHIALMPDCHSGYGMPIGGVLATEGAIVPNAVGVDIGCGMLAVRSNLHNISKEEITEILAIARKTIPVGYEHHTNKQMVGDDGTKLFVFSPQSSITHCKGKKWREHSTRSELLAQAITLWNCKKAVMDVFG